MYAWQQYTPFQHAFQDAFQDAFQHAFQHAFIVDMYPGRNDDDEWPGHMLSNVWSELV